ncbi:hypothetical protein ACJX0J_029301, partial [Zea mays]
VLNIHASCASRRLTIDSFFTLGRRKYQLSWLAKVFSFLEGDLSHYLTILLVDVTLTFILSYMKILTCLCDEIIMFLMFSYTFQITILQAFFAASVVLVLCIVAILYSCIIFHCDRKLLISKGFSCGLQVT